MNIVATRQLARRGVAACGATLVLALTALVAFAPSAQGAEHLYWVNITDGSVSFANLDGSGGGPVNVAGIGIVDPEGMAYDPVTNRLFIADRDAGPSEEGQIQFVNLDGSGAGVFTAPGAPVDIPSGVVVDPIARTAYWVNLGAVNSLAWAKLDGSAGGVLSTAGSTFETPRRIALDPGAGRVYWVNFGAGVASFARVDGSGGGDLSIAGASPPNNVNGVAVDTVGGRLYWLDDNEGRISSISIAGGDGANLNVAGAPPFFSGGLAIDPTARRIYWAAFGNEGGADAFGFAALSGGGGGIDIATSPVDNTGDPLILKSPTGVAAPAIARGVGSQRSQLSCSNGAWAPDFPGSFLYQAPTRFAHQWTLNGAPVAGATAATLRATAPGRYACVVTASNHAGSAAQTSGAAVNVKAASFKLKVAKKKVKAAPGGVVKLKVSAANQGDLANQGATLCVKVPKKAKKDLKARKCKPLSDIGPEGSRAVRLRVRVGPEAAGTYKLKVVTKGAPAKAARVTLQIG